MTYKGTDKERAYHRIYMQRRRRAARLTAAIGSARRTFKLTGHCQRCGWSLADAARVLHMTGTDAFCAECCSEMIRSRKRMEVL